MKSIQYPFHSNLLSTLKTDSLFVFNAFRFSFYFCFKFSRSSVFFWFNKHNLHMISINHIRSLTQISVWLASVDWRYAGIGIRPSQLRTKNADFDVARNVFPHFCIEIHFQASTRTITLIDRIHMHLYIIFGRMTDECRNYIY